MQNQIKKSMVSKKKTRESINHVKHSGCMTIERTTSSLEKLPDFYYVPNYLNSEESRILTDNLKTIDWQKVQYEKFGKTLNTPRYTFCYGMANESNDNLVSWRGRYYKPEPIPEFLLSLKKKIEETTGETFNACILNKYSEKKNKISWHTDDEKFLASHTVPSLSLGSIRKFNVRNYSKEGYKQKMSVELRSGSLSILYNGIEHCISPGKQDGDIRYNITFRNVNIQSGGFGNYYHYNRGSKYQIKNE